MDENWHLQIFHTVYQLPLKGGDFGCVKWPEGFPQYPPMIFSPRAMSWQVPSFHHMDDHRPQNWSISEKNHGFLRQSLQSISVKWWWTPPWFFTTFAHISHISPLFSPCIWSWVPSATVPGHWWRAQPRGSERFDGGVAQTLHRACKCHADHWHVAPCAWPESLGEPNFIPGWRGCNGWSEE